MEAKSTYMSLVRLWMFTIGLVGWAVFVAVSTSYSQAVLASAEPTPTLTNADLPAMHKQIILRTTEGKVVSGIRVQLEPADPALGGPEAGTLAMSAATDAQGAATFAGLGPWLWMASFNGTFEGRGFQPVQQQGRAPYGRTRSGGGFPVMVQRQEEDASATPIIVQGTPQPEIQPSMFVLVPVQNQWVPSLDLALPGEHPQPLIGNVTTQLTVTMVTVEHPQVQATGSSSTAQGDHSGFVRWFYVLPVAIALLALYKAWQEHRGHRRIGAEPPSHVSTPELMSQMKDQ